MLGLDKKNTKWDTSLHPKLQNTHKKKPNTTHTMQEDTVNNPDVLLTEGVS